MLQEAGSGPRKWIVSLAEDEKESSSKQAEAPDALQASEKAAEDYRKLRGEARAAAQRAKLAREQVSVFLPA